MFYSSYPLFFENQRTAMSAVAIRTHQCNGGNDLDRVESGVNGPNYCTLAKCPIRSILDCIGHFRLGPSHLAHKYDELTSLL